jgi:hypothetical protein
MTERDMTILTHAETRIAYLEMCITEELGRMDLYSRIGLDPYELNKVIDLYQSEIDGLTVQRSALLRFHWEKNVTYSERRLTV